MKATKNKGALDYCYIGRNLLNYFPCIWLAIESVVDTKVGLGTGIL